jgi:hypothetical protein
VSVCRYLSTNLCCKILFGGKNIEINYAFILVFFKLGQHDPMVLLTLTFYHGTRVGLNCKHAEHRMQHSISNYLQPNYRNKSCSSVVSRNKEVKYASCHGPEVVSCKWPMFARLNYTAVTRTVTEWQSGRQALHTITNTRQLQVPKPHTIPTSNLTSALHRYTQQNSGSVSKGTVVPSENLRIREGSSEDCRNRLLRMVGESIREDLKLRYNTYLLRAFIPLR